MCRMTNVNLPQKDWPETKKDQWLILTAITFENLRYEWLCLIFHEIIYL